ncbi:hypothetical protein FEM03_20840 [Phragmitibacter flavus]|uniref:DUF3592 domain-containing protein n=1 Tax=Phragmitibacter flavus TaxID=2576071 RepID=A0A5R8K8Z0_9BACT|nr:hypothetical protein [Phragmitibacter flavus]TLD68783.1 hypothetical protein FEM03_20840 [Phragmitibacter flavus]
MSTPESTPPKKFGCIASLFLASFPALLLTFGTAFLVEAYTAFAPGETKPATIIDRQTRLTGGTGSSARQTAYNMTIEFTDGTQKIFSCPSTIYETWPIGMIVQARHFPALDNKIAALTWEPDEQRRSEGHQPVTYTRTMSWWLTIPIGLALLAISLWFIREPRVSRPILIIMLLLSIPIGITIATGW